MKGLRLYHAGVQLAPHPVSSRLSLTLSEAAEEDPGDEVVGVCTKACSPGIFSPLRYVSLIPRGTSSKLDLFPGCGCGYTVIFTLTRLGALLLLLIYEHSGFLPADLTVYFISFEFTSSP